MKKSVIAAAGTAVHLWLRRRGNPEPVPDRGLHHRGSVQVSRLQVRLTYKISQAGLDYPFSLAADLFAQDDLTIANCEGCFTNRASTGKFMSLGAAPEFAEVFKLGFVDVVNTANNHMRDFGSAGREDTLEALAAQGIGYFGDDDTYITEIKGVTIGIVGYTYPINEGKLKKYQKKIEELREAGCTFIIASAHWGKEESLNINLEQRQGAPALIDMGADLVYGHGSHRCSPCKSTTASSFATACPTLPSGPTPPRRTTTP